MRRRVTWTVVVLVSLALVWGVLREIYDPRVRLFVDDLLGPRADPVSVELGEGLALRAYADTRPHIGKVDELQKGLVLIVDGQERIEEGFGFGLPIVRYAGTTYHSRSAEVSLVRANGSVGVVKRYRMDVADRPSRPFTRKYSDVPARGVVVVTTTLVSDAQLRVTVDLSGLAPGWSEAFLMNEQGAGSFTRYQVGSDPLSVTLPGLWDTEDAPCSCWIDPEVGVQFCVATPPGRGKYVGRERYIQYHWLGTYRLSWSGIDLHLLPQDTLVDYTVMVGRFLPDQRASGHALCP